jgi:MinD superfamily P-loop ATPase
VNLLSAAEKLAEIDRSQVRFEPARCLHALDRFSACQACTGLCPVDAIQPGKPPTFDEEACQNCLACLPACPAGAFSADDAVGALLQCAARSEGATIEVACLQHYRLTNGPQDSDLCIQVRGCLAGLGAGAYVALAALGLERVYVRLDACQDCPWESLQKQVNSQVDEANRWLEAWSGAARFETISDSAALQAAERPVWDAANPPLSRRDLFRLASRQGQVAVARSMEKHPDKPGKHPARTRQRILNALSHLDGPADPTASLAGLGFANLTVTEACTACRVCARACPTGALTFEQTDSTHYSLAYDPRLCTGCQVCAHVCAPGAIEIESAPHISAVFEVPPTGITLSAGELTRCQRCNTPIAARPGVTLCPICEMRRKNPFGSIMPPGLATQVNRAQREGDET